MTIEQLEKYRGISANIEAIQMQIDHLYVPIASPNGKTNTGSFSSTPGDPTGKAVMKIIELQEDLSQQLQVQVDMLNEINEWMKEVTVSDPEVAALIRYHYIAGLPWKETALRAYGYKSGHFRARKRVFRYFGRD